MAAKPRAKKAKKRALKPSRAYLLEEIICSITDSTRNDGVDRIFNRYIEGANLLELVPARCRSTFRAIRYG